MGLGGFWRDRTSARLQLQSEGELAQIPSAGTWEGHTHTAAVDFFYVLFPSFATRSPPALGFSSTFSYSFFKPFQLLCADLRAVCVLAHILQH